MDITTRFILCLLSGVLVSVVHGEVATDSNAVLEDMILSSDARMARSAIQKASDQNRIDVLLKGLKNRNSDINYECVTCISGLPKNEKGPAIFQVVACNDPWFNYPGSGENATVQLRMQREVLEIVSDLMKVQTIKFSRLLEPEQRRALAKRLLNEVPEVKAGLGVKRAEELMSQIGYAFPDWVKADYAQRGIKVPEGSIERSSPTSQSRVPTPTESVAQKQNPRQTISVKPSPVPQSSANMEIRRKSILVLVILAFAGGLGLLFRYRKRL